MIKYLIITIIILSLIVFIMIKTWSKQRKEIKALKHDNKIISDNIKALIKHTEVLEEIRKDKNAIKEKIDEAESDEEIIAIMDSITKSNNGIIDNK